MIRVLLVDDSESARWGLSAVLGVQADLAVVGEAEDGAEAVDAVLRCEPDVVLMNLNMPVVDGFVATERVLQVRPGTAVLAISAEMDPARQARARQAGAVGCVLKGAPAGDLVAAIRAAAGRPASQAS